MTHADSIWVKALELHSDSLQSKVDSLQAKLDALQCKTDFLSNVIETANDGVSNQLSATNNLLALVGVIVTIAAIWLGILIEKRKRQIEKMAETIDTKKKSVEDLAAIVDDKKEKVDIIAKATEDLDKKIHSDLKGLYKQLHKEETKSLLERLILEPLDISNIIKLLLARDIDEDSFGLLRAAFMKFLEIVKVDGGIDENAYAIGGYYYEPNLDYQILFFQHYCEQSIKDDIIRPYMMQQLIDIIDGAFKRDMLKSTECLCKALSDETATFDKEDVLVGFLSSLNNTKHREYADLKILLEQKTNPVLLNKAKEICKEHKQYLALFGILPPDVDKSKETEITAPGTDGLHPSEPSA